MLNDEARKIIAHYNMVRHQEGGYYARTYTCKDNVLPMDKRYKDEGRLASSAIYYLLMGNDFSAWHQLNSDEIWHFYKGSPLYLHCLDSQRNLKHFILGDCTLTEGAHFQVSIPAKSWFCAEVIDKQSFTLSGCTVSPGFEFADFKLGVKKELLIEFPMYQEIIEQFCRN